MRAVLRLVISNLTAHRSRSALLIGAVALSAALIVAVGCAMTSLNAAMELRVTSALGNADIRVRHVGEIRFEESILAIIEQHPAVDVAVPRSGGMISVQKDEQSEPLTLTTRGIDPSKEYVLAQPRITNGRRVESDGEIAIDEALAASHGIEPGQSLQVVRFGEPMTLAVVGLLPTEAFENLQRPTAMATRSTVQQITNRSGQISEIQVILNNGADPIAIAEELRTNLPQNIVAEPTERITSGIDSNLRSSNFLFVIGSILSFVAAAFIVLTGLTTNVLERERELAILRCIGSDRRTLAATQLFVGVVLGASGALVGVPLGAFLAWLMAVTFPDRLTAGLVISTLGVTMGIVGSIGAGIMGALWPALRASITRPLAALSVRARVPKIGAIMIASIAGVLLIGSQAVIVGIPDDGQFVFWAYALAGLPLMFIGYFLLGVPIVMLVAVLAGPLISRLFGLPTKLLAQGILATPFRHGFTGGALMVGLGLMISIWTNGNAILRDWIDAIEFPDAFAHGLLGLTPESQRAVEALPFVEETCAITLQKIEDETFGVRLLQPIKTTFIAFEPEPFFAMTRLHWIEGDPEYAQQRLIEGGAIIVANEFRVARGYHVGDYYETQHRGKKLEFEIVGVISSPGLDLVSKYFDIGKEYADRALHSIFGSRADLLKYFGNDAINLIQINLTEDVDDEQAVEQIRSSLGNTMLFVGSGRQIKEQILAIGRGTMRVMSIVAIAAMFIGCLGVGNVVIAGIDARRFQFGVLRAIGADASLLARLLLAEVLLIAITGCILGTLIGLQGSWAGVRLYELLAGLVLQMRPSIGAILFGWALLIGITLLTVLPVVLRVSRQRPRQLLATTKG